MPLTDVFPSLISRVDGALRYRDVNPAYERSFQRPRAAFIGRTIAEVIGADAFARVESHYRRALAGETVTFRERIVSNGADRSLWGIVTVIPERDATGEVSGLTLVIADVTPDYAVRGALQEDLVRRRVLFEETPDGIVVITEPTRQVVEVNPAFAAMLGRSVEETLGLYVWDWDVLFPTPEALMAEWPKLPDEDALFVTRMRRKDGSEFDAEVRCTTAVWGADRAVYCAVRDVTARIQAEAELRRTTEQLHRAVAAGNIGLWEWDLRTGEIYYSIEWKRQLGYAEHEIGPTEAEWQERLHPDDIQRVRRAVRTAIEDPSAGYEDEMRLRHRDGSWRVVLTRGTVERDTAGRPTRMVGSTVDITARVQLESELRHAQKLENIGRLAGAIAHDFNNLLTVILTSAQLGLESSDSPGARENWEQVREVSMQAAALTRQLLSFGRKQIVNPQVLDLNAVVAAMVPMLRRLIGEDIELRIDMGEELGRVTVDPGRIEQVIMNLAVNARDAMPFGGILTIATRAIELPAPPSALSFHTPQTAPALPGSYFLLTMKDTGTGIDASIGERIFEPFFTTKEAGKGTGLGLSTVLAIVEQSGGQVSVESEPGVGTTFSICLPMKVSTPPLESARPGAGGAAAALRRGGSETVLVVEDDNQVRALVSRLLTRAGYAVVVAEGCEQAIGFLESDQRPIHLLLTDVVMPGGSGRQLAERAVQIRPDLKVLYMSGYTDDAMLRHGVLRHEIEFLPKPFTPTALFEKIRRVIDGVR